MLGIAFESGTSTVVKTPLFKTKPCRLASSNVNSYNRAGVVDSLSDRYVRAGHINVVKMPLLLHRKPWGGCALADISSHHLTDVVDPMATVPKGVVTRHVECGEGALAPDKAMTFFGCSIPVGSHDLALRVDEPPCDRIESGGLSVVKEPLSRKRREGGPCAIEGVSSRELARRVDSVDDSTITARRAGRVNRG